jgi:hypothetical protein
MKKTLKKSGVNSIDPKTDFLSVYRSAPEYLKQQSSLQDLVKRVQDARTEKLKKDF